MALHEFTNRVLHLKALLPKETASDWSEFRHIILHLGCQLVKTQIASRYAQLDERAKQEVLAPFISELSALVKSGLSRACVVCQLILPNLSR